MYDPKVAASKSSNRAGAPRARRAGARTGLQTNETRGTTIVAFARDLRLADHPALAAAVRRGAPIVPVFIWSPEEEGRWPPGGASRWWLHQSLKSLADSLERAGSRLIIRRGPRLATLRRLVRECHAGAVFWNLRLEPAAREADRRIEIALRQEGVRVDVFNASLLFDPAKLSTQQGRPFQVFTAFWQACRRLPVPDRPIAPPRRLAAPNSWPASLPLEALRLEPGIDWAGGIRAEWLPGERGAAGRLRRFLKGAFAEYPSGRDRPDRPGTSRLSPHLHFGEVSPRQVWRAIDAQNASDGSATADAAEAFLRELGWREFAHYLLTHFPATVDQALREKFESFPWRRDPDGLRAWQKGETGYPIVDAGMRQLWTTGWMHNRVRMIAGSFLVKDLLIDWRAGAAWFWDTLVDADLANNTLGWQWVAGCGADAAPYFRIFNPVLQGRKFDPEGAYIRRWVPELSRLSATWIHAPAEAPRRVLNEAGVKLGENYPRPVVDHSAARGRALRALRGIS